MALHFVISLSSRVLSPAIFTNYWCSHEKNPSDGCSESRQHIIDHFAVISQKGGV
jgi:hypothetical protein